LFGILARWIKPFVERGEVVAHSPEPYDSLIMGTTVDFARQWLANCIAFDLNEAASLFTDAAWQSLQSVSNGR